MSTRKTVMDAIIEGLTSSTGVNYATQKLDAWWKWPIHRFPGVTIIDRATLTNRIAFPDNTADDMEAELDLEARGYVHEMGGDQDIQDTKRTNLVMDIEKTLKSSTTIDAQVADVRIQSIEEDMGQMDNYAVCAVNVKVLYFYNHNSP